jgi:hypothetical protein
MSDMTTVRMGAPVGPLALIEAIRASFVEAENVYRSGSCYRFYLILRQVYPDAVAYYDGDHVITRIDDRYYDISGEVIPNRHHGPLTDEAVVKRLEACIYGKVEAV